MGSIIQYDVQKSDVPDVYFLIRWELDEATRETIDRDIWILKTEELKRLRDDIINLIGVKRYIVEWKGRREEYPTRSAAEEVVRNLRAEGITAIISEE